MMKKLVLCVALGLAALCGAWAVGWIGLPFSSENRDARLSLQASHPANWNGMHTAPPPNFLPPPTRAFILRTPPPFVLSRPPTVYRTERRGRRRRHPNTLNSLPPPPPPPTEDDVSRWLNVTVRYPEYHAAFAANGVDGPTLFYLTEADFGHLGVKHPVHRAKLLAHLDVLRGRCVCTPPTTPDFWAYLQTNTYRVMYLGALFEYSPRLGFCYIGYFEWEMLSDVLGLFGLSGYAVVSVAALLMLAAPHAVLTVVGARLLLPANYVLAVAYMLSHVSKALTDGREVLALLPELLVCAFGCGYSEELPLSSLPHSRFFFFFFYFPRLHRSPATVCSCGGTSS